MCTRADQNACAHITRRDRSAYARVGGTRRVVSRPFPGARVTRHGIASVAIDQRANSIGLLRDHPRAQPTCKDERDDYRRFTSGHRRHPSRYARHSLWRCASASIRIRSMCQVFIRPTITWPSCRCAARSQLAPINGDRGILHDHTRMRVHMYSHIDRHAQLSTYTHVYIRNHMHSRSAVHMSVHGETLRGIACVC